MTELIPGTEYHPFSCGTQFMDWMESNCYQCKKYVGDNDAFSAKECPIARHIENCSAGIEEFTDVVMLRRMGFIKEDNETMELEYVWACTERAHMSEPDHSRKRAFDEVEPPATDPTQCVLCFD